jgi:cobalt-zinc-cadmium efflux system outer membrane protein
MKYPLSLLAAFLFLIPSGTPQKADAIRHLLDRVASNNETLRALRSRNASKMHELRSENRPTAPEASAYYLPWSDHEGPDYSEFEISQSFAFPSVYALEKERIRLKKKERELEYRQLRQEILLEAEELIYELIHVRKLQALVKERGTQMRKLFEGSDPPPDSGWSARLALKKAKLLEADREFRSRELEERERELLLELEALNGGKDLELDRLPSEDELALDLPPADPLWKERRKEDPELLAKKRAEEAARKGKTLTRHRSMPRPTLGMNTQGIFGERFTGVYGGLSIPLWGAQERKKMAEARVQYRIKQREAAMTREEKQFRKHYRRYRFLKKRCGSYRETLEEADG